MATLLKLENISLRHLHLNGNHIGDNGAEELFLAIKQSNLLLSLNLAHCELSECLWSYRLRHISSLTQLILSYNNISDSGLETLFDGLEGSCCLRHLDISHNLFGSVLSLNFPRFLISNQGLLSLDLSGNMLIEPLQESIAIAISESKSLMTVNISLCAISNEKVEVLKKKMIQNRYIEVSTFFFLKSLFTYLRIYCMAM